MLMGRIVESQKTEIRTSHLLCIRNIKIEDGNEERKLERAVRRLTSNSRSRWK